MSASRIPARIATKPLALLAGLGLVGAGLALPASADDEPPADNVVVVEEDEDDDGGGPDGGTGGADDEDSGDDEGNGDDANDDGEGADGSEEEDAGTDEDGNDEDGLDEGADDEARTEDEAGEDDGTTDTADSDVTTLDDDLTIQQDLVDLRILSFNDFHGRIGSGGDVVGDDAVAVGLACFVEDQRQDNENTMLVSAGDNIGGTTFTSFIADDVPTLDVLNELELDAAAFGNHEFDQGQDDVNDRVLDYSHFPWLAANIENDVGELVYQPYTIVDTGDLNVAVIGAITEDMPNLVAPGGIEGLTFTSMSGAVNEQAQQLAQNDDVDVIIAVVHDGLPGGVDPENATGPFGDLVNNAHESISAIISGHTHQQYIHQLGDDPDGMWVTQTGEYGQHMGVLDLTINADTGEVTSSSAENVAIEPGGADACEAAGPMMQIVDEARAFAEEEGAEVVGEATHAFNRAQNTDGSENRAGESVLGAMVADAHLWAAQQTVPDAQIAFMNPGGLREDLAEGEITFRDAADIQPFANTLYSMELTGAQLAGVLEEQWPTADRDGFLKLGHSSEFTYIYDPEAAAGDRITEMYLADEPIEADESYVVVANNFIAEGGDSFSTFTEGTNSGTTGQIDLESTVSYIQEHTPITPDFTQRAVGLTWISDPEAVYAPGDEVAVDVSSFVFTAGEPVPEVLHTSMGGFATGEFDLDATPVDGTDEAGRAEIRATVPQVLVADQLLSGGVGTMQAGNGSADGAPAVYAFEIVDETNGTVLTLPVTVAGADVVDPPEGTDPGDLPDTGANVGWIALGVLVLLVLGGVLMIRGRSAGAGGGSAAAMGDGGADGGAGGGGGD